MTEKQVTLTGIENKWLYSEEDGDYPKITAPDGCFYCFSFSIDAQQLCEKLNEMQDKINMLNDENEQLKQFQDRVFSWIDMHLQRLPTLRDDEFESDNEFADPSLYSGAIQILETMKRELKGDLK